MSNENTENYTENSNISSQVPLEDEPHHGVDKKLADLMMRGWTLLAESCPMETCGCPLMRNLDGQKYCCGCEMWHFDKDRPVKQRFTELVSLKGKQNVQLPSKHTEVSKLPPKNMEFNYTLNKSVIQALQLKLAYLTNILNSESDLTKSRDILECIRMCMDNIQMAKSLSV